MTELRCATFLLLGLSVAATAATFSSAVFAEIGLFRR
jgi:hypothetical protein